jgi:hypothetical protein
MAIIELYSTRNNNKYPDIYRYNSPSPKLRQQISYILGDAIGQVENVGDYIFNKMTVSKSAYLNIFGLLAREYGVKKISGDIQGSYGWLERYINSCKTMEFLDVLELSCRYLVDVVSKNEWNYQKEGGATLGSTDAINDINERMKQDGFGFQFKDGVLIRVDQEFIHSEVVLPALKLLVDFDGSRNEFLKAHEHYRHGRYEEAITDCNKALESLLKTICHNEKWEYKKGKATMSALVPICMSHGLIPSYLQTQVSSISTLIEQGVSTIRNNSAAHANDATDIRVIPQSLVSYTLHLTATNIVFISESYKDYLNSKEH